MRTMEYEKYIKSPKWKCRSGIAIWKAGYKCEECGASGVTLQTHHLHYENLGCEDDEDLKVLCLERHKEADRVRAIETSQIYWSARVVGYAKKKYGRYWADSVSFDQIEEEFEEFLDNLDDEY